MTLPCPFCFEDKGESARCRHCGFVEGKPKAGALPVRHALRGGDYLVGCALGERGGFGIAYRAWDRRNGAMVVIKECTPRACMPLARAEDGVTLQVPREFESSYRQWLSRFYQEVQWIRGFSDNPHVVRVSDVFEENNTAYYVMPYVDGTDLETFCGGPHGKLPPEQVLEIAKQLLNGLCGLHDGGLVHRDIKPSNIIITRNRHKPVLIDFGAARDYFDEAHSRSHMSMHSPNYSPIEQRQGTAQQGPWTDIYALSATLYRCLTGKPPPDVAQRWSCRGNGTDPFVALKVAGSAPNRRLALLVNKGLALDRAHRPAHAAEALRLLKGDADASAVPTGVGTLAGRKDVPPPGPVLGGLLGLMPAAVVLALGLAVDPGGRCLDGWPVVTAGALAVAWLPLRWWHRRGEGEPPSGAARPGAGADPGASADAVRVTLSEGDRVVGERALAPNALLVIGRSDSRAGLCVANALVSAVHVRVAAEADGCFEVTDLESRNGTYVRTALPAGHPGAWRRIGEPVRGTALSFMLGPPDQGGVLLKVHAAARAR